MSLTGACRCAALCVELLALPAVLPASDCPASSLSREETVRRLEQLDQTGQQAMRAHQFAAAIQAFREQSCLAPESAGVFYELGVAEAASGDFLNARKSFSAAARLEPANSLPLAMLVRVNFSMGDADGLKAALREAAARFPKDGNLHGSLAQFLLKNKQYDLALAESLRAVEASGSSPQSRLELAVLENTVGAYADAIQNAEALEKDASIPDAMRASAAGVAGLSYESSGNHDAAIAHLRRSIALDPSRENSYVALAFIFEKSGRFQDAVDILEPGRRNVPHSAAIWLSLGADLVGSDHYQAGIHELTEFIRALPDEPKAYLQLADAYRKIGDSARETETLRNLAQRQPNYPEIHRLIARAMLNINPPDYPKILEELDLAEKSAPSDPDVFYLRAKVFLATQRDEEAAVALRRSIELRPLDPSPYYLLGRLYQKMGQTKLARETLDRMQFLRNNAPK